MLVFIFENANGSIAEVKSNNLQEAFRTLLEKASEFVAVGNVSLVGTSVQ